jgi:hypothetical protein
VLCSLTATLQLTSADRPTARAQLYEDVPDLVDDFLARRARKARAPEGDAGAQDARRAPSPPGAAVGMGVEAGDARGGDDRRGGNTSGGEEGESRGAKRPRHAGAEAPAAVQGGAAPLQGAQAGGAESERAQAAEPASVDAPAAAARADGGGGATQHRCSLCDVAFGAADLLGAHLASAEHAERQGRVPPFVCSACGEVFQTSTRLQLHWGEHEWQGHEPKHSKPASQQQEESMQPVSPVGPQGPGVHALA